ncbi:MAG TPA: TIGR03086 family metal-binding protein [Pseudonocardiaceae bacterium]
MLHAELARAAAITREVVGGVDDRDLGRPTPCAGLDVRGVLDHLMGVLTVADRAGRKVAQLPPEELWVDRMTGDWRGRFDALVVAAERAWGTDAAWLGGTELLGRPFPAADAGRKLIGELLVHGWDVARATGRAYHPDPAVTATVHEYFARSFAAERRPGAWGAEVPVAPDATEFDRVLGLSGRDPGWTP